MSISELTGGLWLSHFSDKIHPPVTQTEIKYVINIGRAGVENWLFYLQKYKFLTKCLYLFLGDTANQYRETIYIYNTDEIQRDMH